MLLRLLILGLFLYGSAGEGACTPFKLVAIAGSGDTLECIDPPSGGGYATIDEATAVTANAL